MLRGIWGDPERYKDTYWSEYEGRYFAGDGCRIDADGHVLNDGHQVPAVVHQYNKGAAGKVLKRTRFAGRYLVS